MKTVEGPPRYPWEPVAGVAAGAVVGVACKFAGAPRWVFAAFAIIAAIWLLAIVVRRAVTRDRVT